MQDPDKSEKANPLTHVSAVVVKEYWLPNQKIQHCIFPELISRYEKQFEGISPASFNDLQKKVLKSGKFKLKQVWAEKITQTLIATDYESLHLQLHYGYYATKIDVINLKLEYDFATQITIGKGQYGTIYSCEHNEKKIAIKSIKICEAEENLIYSIKKVYKQYFLGLLASELEIGPKILNIFGYDILFISGEAFFSMERCSMQPPQFLTISVEKQKIEAFKTSLYELHLMKFVHRDIKPNNICWSPTFQKYVFIDFGLSTLVEQQKGQKTYCKFAGTYAYCYDEMRRLFTLRNPGYADLYYNDAFGLVKSLDHLKREQSIRKVDFYKEAPQTKNSLFFNFIDILDIKKEFFHNNDEVVFEKIKKLDKMFQACIEILDRVIQIRALLIHEQEKWQKVRQQLQQKIIRQKYQVSRVDRILSSYFLKSNGVDLINSMIPLKQFLESKIIDFNQILKDKQWIQRFHNMINPTLQGYLKNKHNQGLRQNALYIINKIYQHLEPQDTKVFLKKLRRVILFFCSKFQQLKNISGLKRLNQMLLIMKDRQNVVKTRKLILTLISDPFQYCFTSLFYFVITQNMIYYDLPTTQTWYLKNIIKMKEIDQQKIEKLKQFQLILVIAEQIERFEKYENQICNARILFQIFHTVYDHILELEQLIKDSEFLDRAKDIVKVWSSIFLNFLQKSKQTRYKQFCGQPIDQICDRISTKKQFFEEKDKKVPVYFVTVYALHKNLIETLQKTNQLPLIQQIYEFVFDVAQGYSERIHDDFIIIMQANLHKYPKTLSIILKIISYWMAKIIEEPIDFQNCYNQLRFLLPIVSHIYFKKGQSHILQQTEEEVQVEKIIRLYQKKAGKQIIDLQDREAIFQLITIMDNIKMYLLKNDAKSIQFIKQFSKNLLKSKSQQTEKFQFTITRIEFIAVLGWIRNKKLIQTALMRAQFDNQMEMLWKATAFPIGAISSEFILEEIINIYLNWSQFSQAYELLTKIIEIFNGNIKIYHNRKSIIPLRAAFHQFCNKSPHSFLIKIINSPDQPFLIRKRQTVLFFCLMLKKCMDQLQEKVQQKFLKLIVKNIKSMDIFGQAIVKQHYYEMFNKYIRINRRKSLILHRVINRESIQHSQKKQQKLIKLIKELSLQMRPRGRQYLLARLILTGEG